LKKAAQLKSWVKRIVLSEKKKPGNINFIFCSDKYLLGLNKKYLKHNSYTDIITFDNSSRPETIEGDIFISIERVKENALEFAKQHKRVRMSGTSGRLRQDHVAENPRKLKISFDDELHRVMIHGVLHLLGYADKKTAAKKTMQKRENACLKILQTIDYRAPGADY